MAKKVLLTALLSLTLLGSIPTVFAETTAPATTAPTGTSDCPTSTSTDSQDHFSSFDILNVEDCQNLGGTTALPGEIKATAEATGGPGSVAAALILRVINILLLTIGTFAFVTIFYGGILMTTSNGEESKVDRAKSILTQSIMGLIIAFLAYYMVTFVQSFFY
jgi:hypothetical protein